MHGGKREGAGKKATGRTTKVVRVNKETLPYLDKIEDLINTIRQWEDDVKNQKGPRWERAKEMIEELTEIIKD